MREPLSFKVFRVVVLTFLTIFTVVPLYVLFTGAVKPLGDVQGAFEWWPSHPTWRPFVDIWHTVPLGHYFANSLIVCSISTMTSSSIVMRTSSAIAPPTKARP